MEERWGILLHQKLHNLLFFQTGFAQKRKRTINNLFKNEYLGEQILEKKRGIKYG